MRSLVLRTSGGVVALAVGLAVAAAPAVAAGPGAFRLAVGGAVGYGSYANVSRFPERPGPPIRVAGTLVGRDPYRCAVVQVAYSGPADGLEWRTFGRLCGTGRTAFRTSASFLFRGVQPPVRLCAGRTVAQAENGRRCDTYQPAADH